MLEPQTSNIEVKLNNHGRYTWNITINFDEENPMGYKEAVKKATSIDAELKQSFPDHVLRGNGRVAQIDEDE